MPRSRAATRCASCGRRSRARSTERSRRARRPRSTSCLRRSSRNGRRTWPSTSRVRRGSCASTRRRHRSRAASRAPTARPSSRRSAAAPRRCRRTSSRGACSGSRRTSDGPVVTSPAAQGPLAGVTVLDLSTVGPGTRCTRLLADYGARVVKVGAPPAKAGVQVEPAFWAYSARRGWQQARIDLKAPEGRDAFLALAAQADVVLESYRPGVVARLGIAYEDVRRVNPRLVYCSTSGYGQTGPAAAWAGHDLNYLAAGGYLHTSGRGAGGKPPLPGATIAD